MPYVIVSGQSPTRQFAFFSSEGKIWQKQDLTPADILKDLQFATIFISMAQGTSVNLIEDTLAVPAIKKALEFLTARSVDRILVRRWKNRDDFVRLPKGASQDLTTVAAWGPKIIAEMSASISKHVEQQMKPRTAKRAAPVREGIPPELHDLWRRCRVQNGKISTTMRPLMDSELRFKLGFKIKVNEDSVVYSKDDLAVIIKQDEHPANSKVIVQRGGHNVTAAPKDPLKGASKLTRQLLAPRKSAGIPLPPPKAAPAKAAPAERPNSQEPELWRKGYRPTPAQPKIRGLSVVQKMDGQRRVFGVIHSASGKTVINFTGDFTGKAEGGFKGNAADFIDVLEKSPMAKLDWTLSADKMAANRAYATAVQQTIAQLFDFGGRYPGQETPAAPAKKERPAPPPPKATKNKVQDLLDEFAAAYPAYHKARGVAGDVQTALQYRLSDLKKMVKDQPQYAEQLIQEEIDDIVKVTKKIDPAAKAAPAPAPASNSTTAPPQGFEVTRDPAPIKASDRLVFFRANAKNAGVIKGLMTSKFKGVSQRGSNSKNINDVIPIAFRAAVKDGKPYIVFATYFGWKIYQAADSKGMATFNMQGGFVCMPNGDWWFAKLNLGG